MFSSSSIWENHGKFWPVPTLVRFLIHSWILLNDQIAGFIYIPWTTYLIVQYIYHLPNVISPAFNQLSDLAIRKKNCARRRGALLCKAWAEIRPFQDANEDLLTNGRLHLLRWCGREKKNMFLLGKIVGIIKITQSGQTQHGQSVWKMVWVGEIIPSPYY